jgi:hypothetical protein
MPGPGSSANHVGFGARIIDPGWLFVIAGLAILTCLVLIPAKDDLEEARWKRDQALAVEQHRAKRLDNYRSYLAAVEEGQKPLVLALAASQLNQIPTDRSPIPGLTESRHTDASVFGALEPEPLVLNDRPATTSLLHTLCTDHKLRLWTLAVGAITILLGLLPASRARPTV